MNLEFIASIITAVASIGALIVAIVSLVKSNKVAKLQEEVSSLDSRLKQYELDAVEQDLAACVEARLVREGKAHKLKIFNKGRGVATDVDFQIKNDEIRGCFLKDKSPFPRLEQHGSYEEHVMVYCGFPSMVELETFWKDEKGNSHSKTNYVSF